MSLQWQGQTIFQCIPWHMHGCRVQCMCVVNIEEHEFSMANTQWPEEYRKTIEHL